MSSCLPRGYLARSGRALLMASALAITMAVAGANASPPSSDATARNANIVREAFEKWSAGGNVFAGLLAPDIAWTIHGSGPVAGTYNGIDDFINRASMPLVSRLATPIVPRVHQIWSDRDTVIIRFDGSATTTSGAPYRNQFVWIFTMQDGLVSKAEAFLDLAAYQQVVDNNKPREK